MTINGLAYYYLMMQSASCVPPNYMDKQPDINEKMRAILIDWLIEVMLTAKHGLVPLNPYFADL